jgi:hypothetical protein
MSVSTPADRLFAVTFFGSKTAPTKSEADHTLATLKALIDEAHAPEKAKLPWLKLARFGDVPSDKGSLRHDDNVTTISGLVADYDGEEVSFDAAVAGLRRLGITGLVYTSPSHTPAAPRWRLVLPFSDPLPPAEHRPMMAWLNACFAYGLSHESLTLSQSYYFGRVDETAGHFRSEIVDGGFINLIAIKDAVGKHEREAVVQAQKFDAKAAEDDIVYGHAAHVPCVRLLGLWCHEGRPRERAVAEMRALFERSSAKVDDPKRWRERYDDIGKVADWVWRKEGRSNGPVAPPTPATPFPGLTVKDISKRDLKDPLRRVAGLIGEGNYLTLIYGPSTAGKTFLAVDLLFALLLGRLWFGAKTLKCGLLYVAREGEEGFINRIRAYLLNFLDGSDLDLPPHRIVTLSVNLGPSDDGSHVQRIIATVAEMNATSETKVGVVVYDNMRAVAPGMRENFGEDIEAFYAKVREVATATSASPLILDNTGKDTDRGARGTQAKFDLADTVIEVEAGVWTVVKVRDGHPGTRHSFRLAEVALGTVADVDGEPKDIASAVVVPEVAIPPAKRHKLSDALKIGFAIFDNYAVDHAVENQPLGPGTPLVRTVEKDALSKRYLEQRGDLEDEESRRRAFRRFLQDGKTGSLLNTKVLADGRVLVWRT